MFSNQTKQVLDTLPCVKSKGPTANIPMRKRKLKWNGFCNKFWLTSGKELSSHLREQMTIQSPTVMIPLMLNVSVWRKFWVSFSFVVSWSEPEASVSFGTSLRSEKTVMEGED